jgi:hypothetical protein
MTNRFVCLAAADDPLVSAPTHPFGLRRDAIADRNKILAAEATLGTPFQIGARCFPTPRAPANCSRHVGETHKTAVEDLVAVNRRLRLRLRPRTPTP